jgi:hypothetical protein
MFMVLLSRSNQSPEYYAKLGMTTSYLVLYNLLFTYRLINRHYIAFEIEIDAYKNVKLSL